MSDKIVLSSELSERPTGADQVRDQILSMIANKGFPPGQQLPTEPELAATYKVSRSTIREALRSLEQDGLVHAIQGRGRFVSALGALRMERPITKYESITDLLTQLGYVVSSIVLSVEESQADGREAAELGIGEGDPVIRLSRLRLGDDKPLVLSLNTIPRDVLPGPLRYRDWSGSLSAALEAHGRGIEYSSARISATTLPTGLGERHSLPADEPWLLVEETGVTLDGARVLLSRDYHHGSEFVFNVLRRR